MFKIFDVFRCDLKKEIIKRKLERKLKLKELKVHWDFRLYKTRALFRIIKYKTKGLASVKIIDGKFDEEQVLNGQGYTKIEISGIFGILLVKPNLEDDDSIVVYGKMKGFSIAGEDMTMDELIKKISMLY